MSAASPPERSEKEPADASPQVGAGMPVAAAAAAASSGGSLPNNVAAPKTSEESKQPAKMSANDFIFGKLIGEGSFSMVYLAKEIRTNKEYAIKVCYKQHILREKKQRAIMREKQILRILSARPHPFFIRLHSTFHDANKLYFVVTYAKNGELLPHIVKFGSFDADVTRFYSAEIISALEHLHSLGIVHRDLKPENILLDERMHIQITDFGSAKIISREFCDEMDIGEIELNGHNSFVGTAQYVSPEMLSDKSCSPSTDLWALGCIIYQMISGLPPFRASNEYLTFQKILKLKYEFPDGFNSVVRDLVENLLVIDPTQRLGAAARGGYPALKKHEFYTEVRWEQLADMEPPKMLPFLPGTSSNEELRSHYHFSSRRSLDVFCAEMSTKKSLGKDLNLFISIRHQTGRNTLRSAQTLKLPSLTGNRAKRNCSEVEQGAFISRPLDTCSPGFHLEILCEGPQLLEPKPFQCRRFCCIHEERG